MKNALRVLAILIMMVMLLAACSTPAVTSIDDVKLVDLEQVNLVIRKADGTYISYQVEEDSLNELTADGLIKYICHKNTLTYTTTDGDYGLQITNIADLVNGQEGDNGTSYIMLYTTVTAQQDASSYAETINIGTTAVVTAATGVADLTVANGTVIYVQAITF